jgi:hypothetical protein
MADTNDCHVTYFYDFWLRQGSDTHTELTTGTSRTADETEKWSASQPTGAKFWMREVWD